MNIDIDVSNYIRCKLIIKSEHRKEIDRLFNSNEKLFWEDSSIESLRNFSLNYKSSCIPYSKIDSLPSFWENVDDFKLSFDKITGELRFNCKVFGIATYTLGEFLDVIIPTICEDIIHLEIYSNLNNKPKFYKFKDGSIVLCQ